MPVNANIIEESIATFNKDCLKNQLLEEDRKIIQTLTKLSRDFITSLKENNVHEASRIKGCINYILSDTLANLPKSVWLLEKNISDTCDVIVKQKINP